MATIIVDKKTGRRSQVETRGRPRKGETAAQAKTRRISAHLKKSRARSKGKK